MSTSVWYKGKCLYDGSGGILSNLSDRIMETVPYDDGVSDDVLAFFEFLVHPSLHSLDDLSLEDLKVLKELLIKTVNDFENEGYFKLFPGEVEDRIKYNIPLDLPRGDKVQALNFIKGLEEVIKELEAEKEQEQYGK